MTQFAEASPSAGKLPPKALSPERGRRVQVLERQLARELRALQSRLSGPVEDLLRKVQSGQRFTPQVAAEVLARLRAVAGTSGLLNGPAARVAALVRQLAELGAQDAAAELQEALREVRRADRLRVTAPRVSTEDVEAYRSQAGRVVQQIAAEHYQAVQEVVAAGLRAGQTDAEVAARLRRLKLGVASAHAATWARTESTRFYTLGRTRGIEAGGEYVWGYEYVVIVDVRTTDICREFVGKRVPKAEMRLYPPFHFNCRTTVRAVLPEAYTDEPEQPAGTELPPDVKVATGFGADPRDGARPVAPTEPSPPASAVKPPSAPKPKPARSGTTRSAARRVAPKAPAAVTQPEPPPVMPDPADELEARLVQARATTAQLRRDKNWPALERHLDDVNGLQRRLHTLRGGLPAPPKAATRAEAAAWAQTYMVGEVSYGRMSVDACNEVNAGLYESAQAMPRVVGRLNRLATGSLGTAAGCYTARHASRPQPNLSLVEVSTKVLNRTVGTSPVNANAPTAQGYPSRNVVGLAPRTVVAHELGHLLDNAASNSPSELWPLSRAMGSVVRGMPVVEKERAVRNLSRYGLSSREEFLAESFALYVHDRSQLHPAIVSFFDAEAAR